MSPSRYHCDARRALALCAAGLVVLAGCAAQGTSSAAAPLAVLRIDAPVHEPVWSQGAHAVLALTDDGRVARITPDPTAADGVVAQSTLSGPLGEVGENIATDPVHPTMAYVAQPRLGRVAAIDVTDLRQVATFPLGPSPSYLATDDGSQELLALSEDRTTVSGVNLEDRSVLPPQAVRAGADAELDGPARGRLVEYHVVGPDRIAHYKGAPGSVTDKGEIDVRADKSAGDKVKIDRLYVAERGTDRLLAVETPPDHDGLAVVAQQSMGAPVREVGTDETRVYAVTDDALIVLEANSFRGLPRRSVQPGGDDPVP